MKDLFRLVLIMYENITGIFGHNERYEMKKKAQKFADNIDENFDFDREIEFAITNLNKEAQELFRNNVQIAFSKNSFVSDCVEWNTLSPRPLSCYTVFYFDKSMEAEFKKVLS